MKEKIVEFLKQRDNWSDFDMILIKELFYNIEIAEMAKENIAEVGIMDATGGQNKTIVTYSMALKGIMTIITKLGISPQERKKLKMSEGSTTDLLDSIITNN